MRDDCYKFTKRCLQCHFHADHVHVPPTELHNLATPWPFAAWGIDMIGEIRPPASNGHRFIVVAIDYFSKWVEAKSFTTVTTRTMARFIERNIICRYGIPHHVITDNGVQFQGATREMLARHQIEHHRSSPYKPQLNGAVEAANKTIKQMLTKMSDRSRDWAEKLPFAIWGYRTTIRTSTGATPYSLVYGMDEVLPVEIEMRSLWVVLEEHILETEWIRDRVGQLDLLDEKRLWALDQLQMYQQRLANTYNKKVKTVSRPIKVGDLVLKQLRHSTVDPRGKFQPKWEGPFVVKRMYSHGGIKLIDMEGIELAEPINIDRLRYFYV
ncbi:hypothetical protein M5689_024621 [Euphorbia peplus]|nr:hypothetical protein M5689_024621 [Euphorbia peplus]